MRPIVPLLLLPLLASASRFPRQDPTAPAGAPVPRTVGTTHTPGESALWVFEQGEREIGRCWSRYDGVRVVGSQRLHAFRSCVRLVLPAAGEELRMELTADLWTDDHGHPHWVDHRAAVRDVRTGVELVREGDRLHAQVWQGPAVTERDVDLDPGAFALTNNFLGQLELPLRLAPPDPSAPTSLPLVSVNALTGLELTLRPGDEPGVFRDSLGEVLHLDEEGRLLRVEVPLQGLVMRRVEDAFEPFTVERPGRRVRPADLTFEEVRIEGDGVSLAGELSRPKGVEGPLPAVFFVSGSGGQDRDGVAGGIETGTGELLDHLTRAGYLVLRVDDRGVGASTAPADELTFDDLLSDARHCVAWLRSRPEADPARVVLIGHSEGGLTVPLLALEDPAPAAVVLMAAPARPLDVLLEEQLLRGARLEGADEARLEALRADLRRVAAGLRADPGARPPLPEDLAFLRGSEAWFASHLGRDPLQAVVRVPCPVLLLQGGRDVQVSPERDARALAAALARAQHPDATLVLLPELDHLFQRTEEGSTGLDYLDRRPLDPGFLEVLTSWLDRRLAH